MNFIIGAAGFAKEVAWLINELDNTCTPHYFVAKDASNEKINDVPVISENEFEQLCTGTGNYAFISMGSPVVKHLVHEKLKNIPGLQFPSIIHPSVLYDRRKDKIVFGEGTIVCAGNILTTDIVIGNFVHLNLGCTVGHDSVIGDFTTISPGAHISGNVTIGKSVFIGTGAVILERLTVWDNAVIGAGAVVTKSITEPGTYAGIPAKKIN
jgi:sugar O-acyltransferase (sialic acid O-acetyltransferase NeuD family)